MTDIATHIRIFDQDPTDDLVVKRTASLAEIRKVFTKKATVPELFKTANNLACLVGGGNGNIDPFVAEIESAIRKKSQAFVLVGNELQLTVCAQLAVVQLLENASTTTGEVQIADIIAIGLWSALAFQAPRSEAKLEALRAELLQNCQRVVLTKANGTRKRLQVPDVTFEKIETTDAAAIGEAVTGGLKNTIESLRINAAIDREEIDLLWWVIVDWCKLLGRRFWGTVRIPS